jgi:hypothetical protein
MFWGLAVIHTPKYTVAQNNTPTAKFILKSVAIKSPGGILGIMNKLYLSHGVLSSSSIAQINFMNCQYILLSILS